MKQSIKSCKKIGQDGLQHSLFPYCLCFSLSMIGHTLHCRCFLIRITRGKWLAKSWGKTKNKCCYCWWRWMPLWPCVLALNIDILWGSQMLLLGIVLKVLISSLLPDVNTQYHLLFWTSAHHIMCTSERVRQGQWIHVEGLCMEVINLSINEKKSCQT